VNDRAASYPTRKRRCKPPGGDWLFSSRGRELVRGRLLHGQVHRPAAQAEGELRTLELGAER